MRDLSFFIVVCQLESWCLLTAWKYMTRQTADVMQLRKMTHLSNAQFLQELGSDSFDTVMFVLCVMLTNLD